MKKTLTLVLAFILLSSLVSAWGLTYPQPSSLELKRGESARYWVTVDNMQGDADLRCDITNYGSQELGIEFDTEEELIVTKGTVQPLYGTITALEGARVGAANTLQFCPNCYSISSESDAGTSGVVSKYCVPFKADVVEVRTRINAQEQIPPKPVDYTLYYIIGGIIALLIIIWLFLLSNRSKRSKKSKAQRAQSRPEKNTKKTSKKSRR